MKSESAIMHLLALLLGTMALAGCAAPPHPDCLAVPGPQGGAAYVGPNGRVSFDFTTDTHLVQRGDGVMVESLEIMDSAGFSRAFELATGNVIRVESGRAATLALNEGGWIVGAPLWGRCISEGAALQVPWRQAPYLINITYEGTDAASGLHEVKGSVPALLPTHPQQGIVPPSEYTWFLRPDAGWPQRSVLLRESTEIEWKLDESGPHNVAFPEPSMQPRHGMEWGEPPVVDMSQWQTAGLEAFALSFSDVKRLVSSDDAFVSFFDDHPDAWLERVQHLRVEEPKSQAYRWEVAWHSPTQRLSFVIERRCYEDQTMQVVYGDCVTYWGSGDAVGQEAGPQGEVHESDPRRPPLGRSVTFQKAVQTATMFTDGAVPPLVRWTARATFSDEAPADFEQPSLPVFYFGVGEVHRTPSYTPDVKHDARAPSVEVRMVRMSHAGWLLNPFPEPSSD